MKSPFPGMDPYLERHWLDVQSRLIVHISDVLNERLPDGFVARIDERERSELELAPWSKSRVRVYLPAAADPSEAVDGISFDAPFKLVLDLDPITEKFIRVLDGDQTITAIELISPTNKTGKGLEEYQRKREELIAGGVHVVEIDLVRRGSWRRLLRPYSLPIEAEAEYRVIIYTGAPRRAGYAFPSPMRKALPEIPIPLRPTDQPVKVPLQELIERVYVRGRYSMRLDYTQPCDPPLECEDATWAEELLKSAGKR